jgi:uncharacterized protein YxeA
MKAIFTITIMICLIIATIGVIIWKEKYSDINRAYTAHKIADCYKEYGSNASEKQIKECLYKWDDIGY